MPAILEHANFTATDADHTARWLCQVFGWRIRWQGDAINGGHSVHVGGDDSYLAIYTPAKQPGAGPSSYATAGGMNHVGVVVDDLDATEARVRDAGFTPQNHADYDPGRRFYFDGDDGVEYEVVQYA